MVHCWCTLSQKMATTLVANISLNLKDKTDNRDKTPTVDVISEARLPIGFSLTAPSVHQKQNPKEALALTIA